MNVAGVASKAAAPCSLARAAHSLTCSLRWGKYSRLMQRVRCAAARRVTTAHSRTSLPQKLSLSPISAPSGGVSGSTTVCSSFDAHRSMPNDLMPRMLRGYVWHGRGRERAQGRAAARVSLPRVVAPSATTQAPSQRQRAVPGGTFGAPSRCQALPSPPCHPFEGQLCARRPWPGFAP